MSLLDDDGDARCRGVLRRDCGDGAGGGDGPRGRRRRRPERAQGADARRRLNGGQRHGTDRGPITANDNTIDANDKTVTVSARAENDLGATEPGNRTLTISDDSSSSTAVRLTPSAAGVSDGVVPCVRSMAVTTALDGAADTNAPTVTLEQNRTSIAERDGETTVGETSGRCQLADRVGVAPTSLQARVVSHVI